MYRSHHTINVCPKGMVYRDRLRSLAGLGSWIAGLAPQVKPLIRQIWAAIAAPVQSSSNPPVVHKFTRAAKGATPKLVYHKQIAAALRWLELLALGNQIGLSKLFISRIGSEMGSSSCVMPPCGRGGRVLGKCVRVL